MLYVVCGPLALATLFEGKLRFKSDDCESEPEEDEATPTSKKKKKKTPKKKKPKAKGKKTKKHPEEKPKPKPGTAKAANGNYVAGGYSKQRMEFIRAAMADGVNFRAASKLWNASAEREHLLEGMSRSELIRRRFIKPDKKK